MTNTTTEEQALQARNLGGDGYDFMMPAGDNGWIAVAGWGRDGWDLGDWPYVVIYARHKISDPDPFGVLYYVEGDVTITNHPTREAMIARIDQLAHFHWRANGEEWIEDFEAGHEPSHLCGPFSWKRAAAEKEIA